MRLSLSKKIQIRAVKGQDFCHCGFPAETVLLVGVIYRRLIRRLQILAAFSQKLSGISPTFAGGKQVF
jgi:hypothetical protein